MPTDPTRLFARQMFSATLRHASPGGPTDRELLAKFATDRDEEVFAELVRRHGPVVLAVCRRVTGHIQDAEDAFQAAFLVLARRAGQVVRPELLGNWLYGVAVRTALEARSTRRRVKEQQPVSATPEPVAPTPPDDDPDLRRVIDEELARLPEKYRTAVVLCDIEGLSRKDAAGRLRVPEGTLSSRLAHARKILAQRLTHRGIVASFGAVASVFGREANATTISTDLVQLTARAAARFAPGGVVPPDIVSPRVMTLTNGVMKAMIVTRLRLITGATVLTLSLFGLGVAAVIGQNPATAPRTGLIPAETADPLANGTPSAKSPGKIPAKGIEDDDVPYPAFPQQAVARLEDGKVIVRQRLRRYKLTAALNTGYQKHDAADVSVFDMKGNRVATKVWKEKLKEDLHVLLAFDGLLPHPRELALFKDDVLLIVFPGISGFDGGHTPPTPAGSVPVSSYQPITTYHPVRNPDGTVYFEPRTVYQPVTPYRPTNALVPPAPDSIPPRLSPIAPQEQFPVIPSPRIPPVPTSETLPAPSPSSNSQLPPTTASASSPGIPSSNGNVPPTASMPPTPSPSPDNVPPRELIPAPPSETATTLPRAIPPISENSQIPTPIAPAPAAGSQPDQGKPQPTPRDPMIGPSGELPAADGGAPLTRARLIGLSRLEAIDHSHSWVFKDQEFVVTAESGKEIPVEFRRRLGREDRANKRIIGKWQLDEEDGRLILTDLSVDDGTVVAMAPPGKSAAIKIHTGSGISGKSVVSIGTQQYHIFPK